MADVTLRRGIYDPEYFNGCQVSLFIGDVWVDEVVSLGISVSQDRRPIYGYASPLYDDISKGNVLVQGQFAINFREAGYLWLILNRYHKLLGKEDLLSPPESVTINTLGQPETIDDILGVNALSKYDASEKQKVLAANYAQALSFNNAAAVLKLNGQTTKNGTAATSSEDVFAKFEKGLWGPDKNNPAKLNTRRADDPKLNPFDIYIAYGDIDASGKGGTHSTVRKLLDVTIVGSAQQIIADDNVILESYQFIARDLI